MTIYELDSDIITDEIELGLRVATALYAENKTNKDNFIRVLEFKHRTGRVS